MQATWERVHDGILILMNRGKEKWDLMSFPPTLFPPSACAASAGEAVVLTPTWLLKWPWGTLGDDVAAPVHISSQLFVFSLIIFKNFVRSRYNISVRDSPPYNHPSQTTPTQQPPPTFRILLCHHNHPPTINMTTSPLPPQVSYTSNQSAQQDFQSNYNLADPTQSINSYMRYISPLPLPSYPSLAIHNTNSPQLNTPIHPIPTRHHP